MKIDKELVKAIKHFEEVHKKYLNKDGTVNRDGYKLLNDAEVNWQNDPKWHDYEQYHLQPRLNNYWYDPDEDKEYKAHWIALHPKLAEKHGVEIN